MTERLFTVYQVADLLGAVPGEVMGWIDRGWLHARRTSNEPLRVSESSLIEFLKDRGIDIEKIMARAVLSENNPPRDVIPLPRELLNPMSAPRTADAMPIDAPASPRPQLESTPLTAPAPQPPLQAPATPQQAEVAAPAPAPAAAEPAPQGSPQESHEPSAAQPPQDPAVLAARQVVQAILKDAVNRRATAIHLDCPDGQPALRLRIDGVMIDKTNFRARLPKNVAPLLGSQLLELAAPAEPAAPVVRGSFTQTFDEREVRFDLVAVPTAQGRRIVLHVGDPRRQDPAFSELGLGEKDEAIFRDLLAQRSGLIVLTGTPGSGAGTSLLAMLARAAGKLRSGGMVQRKADVALAGVNHVPLDAAGLSFAAATEALALQDTDVIALQEIREPAAAQAAFAAALDGRLVLGRLFSRTAPVAAAMLATMGCAGWPLSQSLLAVVAQVTVRRLCPSCRKEVEAAELPERLGLSPQDVAFPTFIAQGCSQCGQTGYNGRTGIFSVLRVDERVAAAVRADADAVAIERAAATGDFKTLLASGLEKVRNGITTLAELGRAL